MNRSHFELNLLSGRSTGVTGAVQAFHEKYRAGECHRCESAAAQVLYHSGNPPEFIQMDSFNSPYVRLIPIWYQDEDGNTVELRTDYVTLKRLTENHSLVKWELVQVWILHPKRHRRATWKIGIDVSREEFERFVDPDTNSLFALTTFENGKPYEQLLPKSQWMKAKAAFDQQNPSNSDGFDDPADSSNLTFGMWARQLPPGGKIRVRVPRQEDD